MRKRLLGCDVWINVHWSSCNPWPMPLITSKTHPTPKYTSFFISNVSFAFIGVHSRLTFRSRQWAVRSRGRACTGAHRHIFPEVFPLAIGSTHAGAVKLHGYRIAPCHSDHVGGRGRRSAGILVQAIGCIARFPQVVTSLISAIPGRLTVSHIVEGIFKLLPRGSESFLIIRTT